MLRKPRWSKSEEAELRKKVRAGLPLNEILIPNRSSNAIRIKAQTIFPELKNRTRKTWHQDEIETLLVLVRKDLSPKKIFFSKALPQRSLCEITRKIRTLRKARRLKRAKKRKLRVVLSGSKRAKLIEFIRDNYKLVPTGTIAKRFKISESVVRRLRREIDPSFSHQDAMQNPALREALSKASAAARKKFCKEWREKEKQRLLFLREKLRKEKRPPEPRECKVCKTEWFKTTDFFSQTVNGTRRNPKPAFLRTCVLCRYKQD